MGDTQSRLLAHLKLGEEICARAEGVARAATAQLAASGRHLTFRDSVLTGLALKIDSAFRALLDDCRGQRVQAMHHLKTMAEAFIYFHVVTKDDSQRMAEQVLAEAMHRKVVYLKDIAAPEAHVCEWRAVRDELRGKSRPLPPLESLAKAHSGELGAWYSRVYRLACEPAHLGDLLEFMPGESEVIKVASAPTASSRAQVALHYGIAIELAVLRAIHQGNDVDMSVAVDGLEQRFHEVSQRGESR
jgi:hypothetical protein